MSDTHKNHQERTDDSAKKCNNNPRARAADKTRRRSDIHISKSLSWVLRHAAPSVGLKLAADGFVPVEEVLALNHPRFRTKDGRPKYTLEDIVRVVQDNDKQRYGLKEKDVFREESPALMHDADRADAGLGDGVDGVDGEQTKPHNNVAEGCARKNTVLCIRANQGHSLKGLQSDELLTLLTREKLSRPNFTVVHGTTRKAWVDHIRHEGLSRMKRNHIHFATGLPPRHPAGASTKKKHTRGNPQSSSATAPISGMRSTSEVYIYVDSPRCAEEGVPFYESDNGVILTAGVCDGMLPTTYFEKVVCASSGQVLWKPADGQRK